MVELDITVLPIRREDCRVNDPHKTTQHPDVTSGQMPPAALQGACSRYPAPFEALLTRDRGELPAAYLNDAALRTAYQIYFLPPNRAKVRLALTELSLHPRKALPEGPAQNPRPRVRSGHGSARYRRFFCAAGPSAFPGVHCPGPGGREPQGSSPALFEPAARI